MSPGDASTMSIKRNGGRPQAWTLGIPGWLLYNGRGRDEKERHLKEEEEAPLLGKQKVQEDQEEDQEEDKCCHPKEVKMDQEEHLEKVLQACEVVDHLEVEKQQQAQLEEEPEEEKEGRNQEQLQKEEKEEEQEKKKEEEKEELLQKGAEAQGTGEQQEQQPALEGEQERRQGKWARQEKERLLSEPEEKRRKEECQHQEQKELTEEQEEAKDVAAAAGDSKGGTEINPDNHGMGLNSENSTNDKTRAQKRVVLFDVPQLSPALISQLCQPLPPNPLFGSFGSPRVRDVFNKSKLQDQTPKTTPKDS